MAADDGALGYHRLPTFMKVVSPSRDMDELRLPPEWVAVHGGELPFQCRFIMPNGMGWTVRLLRIESGCHFHAGWPEFKRDNDIRNGDTLMFTLVDVGTFHVKRFNRRTGCPPKEDMELLPEDVEVEGNEYPDVESADDYEPSDHDSESTDGEDYVDDTGELNDDECPLFTVQLTRTHMSRTLEIPFWFWQRYVCKVAHNAYVYFNVDGKTWCVLLQQSSRKIWVQHGWRRFQRGNGLRSGMCCHFQLIDVNEVIFYVWFDE